MKIIVVSQDVNVQPNIVTLAYKIWLMVVEWTSIHEAIAGEDFDIDKAINTDQKAMQQVNEKAKLLTSKAELMDKLQSGEPANVINSYYSNEIESIIEENLGASVYADALLERIVEEFADDYFNSPPSQEKIQEIITSFLQISDSLTQLKDNAYKAVSKNHHTLSPWDDTAGKSVGAVQKSIASCIMCGMTVEVTKNFLFPALNSMQGEALNNKCPIPLPDQTHIIQEFGSNGSNGSNKKRNVTSEVIKEYSDCCFAEDTFLNPLTPFAGLYSSVSMCPSCKKHCKFIQVASPEEIKTEIGKTKTTIWRLAEEEETKDLKTQMVDYLVKGFGTEYTDDIEVAIYWFANDWHGGQGDELYSILSTSPYSPGPNSTLKSEGESVEMLYAALEDKFAPVSIRKLKDDAMKACEARQHEMNEWDDEFASQGVATATCKHCGAQVLVNAKPAPNEIDISGKAVAVNCPGPYPIATKEELDRDFGNG
jgi:hypothetical protein